MTLSETAFAKVNLALHIRRRRSDGYHDIETIFAFADFGDTLTAQPADSIDLQITGRFAAGLSTGPDNLVVRAAEALARRHDVTAGAALTLGKQLPVASGIGGGSADAAAALRLLNRLWSLDLTTEALAAIGAELGADVPACVYSGTLRGGGIGTDLQLLNDNGLAGLHVVLVNPMQPVATGPVFGGWDGIDRGPLAQTLPLDAALAGRNDLAPSAMHLCPAIAEVLSVLDRQPGASLVRMSGSGATCFALFENEDAAQLAKQLLDNRYPGWWRARGRLR